MATIKVMGASAIGMSTSTANLFVEHLEPALKALVLLGQIGVAVVTVLYIYYQGRQIRKNLEPKPEAPPVPVVKPRRKKKRK